MEIKRTDSQNKDFVALVKELDADLAIRDGDEHEFYSRFNKIESIKQVIVVYEKGIPIACGAIKEYEEGITEIKRMYTATAHRGKGVASLALAELEKWATELKYVKCILETGVRQPEAIALYKKCGYSVRSNYGQYKGIENSVCFEKQLI